MLARKTLSSEVMESSPLVFKLWLWMLLQASFKNYGDLKRGQFFTRLKDIQKAMGYKVGFRTVRPTIKEIRGSMKVLMKGLMIGTTKVLHGMIITILNYDYYQNPENYEGHNEGHSKGHNEGTILTRKNKERKDPSEISSEISSLVLKLFPSGKDLFEQTRKAISTTRKTGKIKDTVILSMLKGWERYTPGQVEKGARIYLEKSYHLQSRDEKYLRGVIRNQRDSEGPKEPEPEPAGALQKQTAALRKVIEETPTIPCPDTLRPEFMERKV